MVNLLRKPELYPRAFIELFLNVSKIINFSVFDCSKRGVLNFTKTFDLENAVSDAGGKIEEIFNKSSLALDGETSVAKNTKVFLNWLIDKYYGEFDKKIGFSRRSHDDKLWPGKGILN
jgi:hypothetical protein